MSRWVLMISIGCVAACSDGEPPIAADASVGADAHVHVHDAGPSEDDAATQPQPDGSTTPDSGSSAGCALTVQPRVLDFGAVEPGRRSVLPIELVNSGDADCAVAHVHLTGDGELGLLDGYPSSVPAGGSRAAWVRFDAADPGVSTAILQVVRGTELLSIDVEGTSTSTPMRVVPSVVDLGSTTVGCRQDRGVSLFADRNVRVTAAVLDGPSALTASFPVFPAELTPSNSLGLTVAHWPEAIGEHTGRIQLFFDRASKPVVIGVVGRGTTETQVSERFPPVRGAVDVLFVIDDSASIADEQAALRMAARTIIDRLLLANVDVRLGVTTTDPAREGRLIEQNGRRWLDSATPDLGTAFSALVGAVGTTGSGMEAGLESAYRALSGASLGGANAGFLRGDASLAVIVLTDENDASPRQPSFYGRFIHDLKAGRRDRSATLNALVIAPGDPPACRGDGTPGPRYIDVARQTGGTTVSICTNDWEAALEPLGDVLLGRRSLFVPSARPDPATVEVLVDLVPATGWTWEEGGALFAPDSRPPATATVEIRYAPLCL